MIWLLALVLIFLGLFLVFLGLTTDFRFESFEEEDIELQEAFREEREEKQKREVKAGGVVLIGPIPIVFGDSKYAFYALILTIVLMVMSIILLFGLRL
ncbi:TIGR00304 family membrane protein [Archaeoglobus sp.]